MIYYINPQILIIIEEVYMERNLVEEIFQKKYSGKCPQLCRESIITFATKTLETLFPQRSQKKIDSKAQLQEEFYDITDKLSFILSCIHKELQTSKEKHNEVLKNFEKELLILDDKLTQDAQFILNEDPASNSLDEVFICYPGFFAIAIYRLAHFFYKQEVQLLPRILSEFAHEKTGIDIHPGAEIQSPFFIDHGTGIVIGETTQIGKNCKIFQGVTLGALSVKRIYKNKKRHPTLEDNCMIYSNATILGGNTTIGANSIIGGNVWITESIPKDVQVYREHGYEIRTK
jgi:serine O-acetyltransferase